MSINYHSDFKQQKCWSCKYFMGKREYKKGIFGGESICTEDKGFCVSNKNKVVFERGWCNKYEKWDFLDSLQLKKELELEKQEIEKNKKKILDDETKPLNTMNSFNYGLGNSINNKSSSSFFKNDANQIKPTKEQIRKNKTEVDLKKAKLYPLTVFGIILGIGALLLFVVCGGFPVIWPKIFGSNYDSNILINTMIIIFIVYGIASIIWFILSFFIRAKNIKKIKKNMRENK